MGAQGTRVFGLAGTHHEKIAKELGLPFTAELYGDVQYTSTGTLVIDRKKKPWTPEATKKHIANQLDNSSVTAVTGEDVELPVCWSWYGIEERFLLTYRSGR